MELCYGTKIQIKVILGKEILGKGYTERLNNCGIPYSPNLRTEKKTKLSQLKS
jgi:hypothetical protein